MDTRFERDSLVLARGATTSFKAAGTPLLISCLAGTVWVTASGCPEDFLLSAGETVLITGRAKIVVEAIRAAAVRLEVFATRRAAAAAVLPPARRAACVPAPEADALLAS